MCFRILTHPKLKTLAYFVYKKEQNKQFRMEETFYKFNCNIRLTFELFCSDCHIICIKGPHGYGKNIIKLLCIFLVNL